MKKRLLALTIALTIVLSLMPVALADATSTWGSDYADRDTFYISTEAELRAFAELVNSSKRNNVKDFSGKIVNLTANITLTDTAEWERIGNKSSYAVFAGTFNGNNNTISGLTISGTSTFGLFGIVSGEIKDLKLTDVNITSSGSGGALAATLNSGAKVSNVTVEGTITQAKDSGMNACWGGVGGIIGKATSAEISNCISYVTIETDGPVAGGIAASAQSNCSITDCGNYGNITAGGQAGGIAGSMSGTITNCSNSGTITGDNSAAQNFTEEVVNDYNQFGGIVGQATAQQLKIAPTLVMYLPLTLTKLAVLWVMPMRTHL